MTTWAAILERGADYDVDVASVRAALAERRVDGENADEQRPESDTDE